MKTRLCSKTVSSFEQELSTLFPKHPYFLLTGIKMNECRLACQNQEIEEHFLKDAFWHASRHSFF
jgi:hypothetical protein